MPPTLNAQSIESCGSLDATMWVHLKKSSTLIRLKRERLLKDTLMSEQLGHLIILSAIVSLSACATPARMHDEAQLNTIATGCGLALGELIQDESEKRLLLAIRQTPTVQQRVCVARRARRNGLKLVFVTMQFPESGS
jgi:hypothetical protein